MAGLLDIFGSTPDIYAGLLGEEGMAQAKRQAQSDALLNLSAALMKAGAPSRTPQGLGLGLVEGMQAAGRGYKESMQGALQEKLAQQKIAEAIAARKRSAGAQEFLTSVLQPQLVSESTTGPSGVPYPVNQVRQATLQELIPQFAKYGTEGFDALSKYLDVQKAGKPEYKAVGDYLYEIPMEGAPRQVAGQAKLPTAVQEYNFAVGQGYKGTFEQYERDMKKAGATSINMPGEGERKAAVLANRLNFGVQQMNEAIGKDPSAAMPNTAVEAARFFSQTDWLPNKLTSPQRQIVESAQLDVLDAALTLGTGAAYTREQLEGYRKSYFPQLQDDQATIKSKQKRLQNLLESAEIASGRAASQIKTPKPNIPSESPITDLAAAARAELQRRRGGQ